jgi:hypothetical protein
MDEAGEHCTVVFARMLRYRLVGGGGAKAHLLGGSVTINEKTTVHYSPGPSMTKTDQLVSAQIFAQIIKNRAKLQA